jgi:CIC family chloride channel protein
MPDTIEKNWQSWLPRLLARSRLREDQIFLVLTLIIGVVAGLSAVLFHLAINSFQLTLFGLEPSALRLVLVPTIVSLGAGVLLARYFRDSRGSGVPQTKEAFHLHDGFIRARTPVGKFFTGILCIGSGHALGREGPSVQIGAGLASVSSVQHPDCRRAVRAGRDRHGHECPGDGLNGCGLRGGGGGGTLDSGQRTSLQGSCL